VCLKRASTLKEDPEAEVLASAEACITVWNVDLERNKIEGELRKGGLRTHNSHRIIHSNQQRILHPDA